MIVYFGTIECCAYSRFGGTITVEKPPATHPEVASLAGKA